MEQFGSVTIFGFNASWQVSILHFVVPIVVAGGYSLCDVIAGMVTCCVALCGISGWRRFRLDSSDTHGETPWKFENNAVLSD